MWAETLRQKLDLTLNRAIVLLFVAITMVGGLALGYLISQNGPAFANNLFLGTIGALLVGTIFFRPFFGLVFILASMPLQAKYPDVPIFSSILSLIGLVTFAGYIFKSRLKFESNYLARPQFLLGLGYVLWMTFTNLHAAINGETRNWLWTYIQLLLMVWLSAELSPPRLHRILMIFCVITGCINAASGIPEANITTTMLTTVRGGGDLTGNQDETAMFLTFAVAFAMYLGWRTQGWKRFLFGPVIILLSLGIIVTISRTGFIMLVITLLLMFFLLPTRSGQRQPGRLKDKLLWLSAALVVAILVVPSNYWQIIAESVRMSGINSQETATASWRDTSVVRYALWDSALRIWRDYPVAGVGVGQFSLYNRYYLDADFSNYSDKVPHNAFVTVLVETGFVGEALYLLWLVSIAWDLWRIMRGSKSPEMVGLAVTWMVTLIAFCVMGLTTSVQYYKPIWMIAGISAAMWHYYRLEQKSALAQRSAAATSANAGHLDLVHQQ